MGQQKTSFEEVILYQCLPQFADGLDYHFYPAINIIKKKCAI